MQVPAESRCCVCLSARLDVLAIGCTHLICAACAEAGDLHACPVCSLAFPTGHAHRRCIEASSTLARHLCETTVTCGCGEEVSLLAADDHHCNHLMSCSPCFESAEVHAVPPPPAVNRSTFTCPVCKEANLSRRGLLDHCNKKHKNMKRPIAAVCPVCLAMPWADPSYVSQDFLSHLNLRHQCDYDTITDFELDEETMLQRALQASASFDEEAMLQQALQASLESLSDVKGTEQIDAVSSSLHNNASGTDDSNSTNNCSPALANIGADGNDVGDADFVSSNLGNPKGKGKGMSGMKVSLAARHAKKRKNSCGACGPACTEGGKGDLAGKGKGKQPSSGSCFL